MTPACRAAIIFISIVTGVHRGEESLLVQRVSLRKVSTEVFRHSDTQVEQCEQSLRAFVKGFGRSRKVKSQYSNTIELQQ